MRFWIGSCLASIILTVVFCLHAESVLNFGLGDGGLATNAELYGPVGIAVNDNNLYIVESIRKRVRRVNLETGIIATIAGGGRQCFQKEYAPAKPGCLGFPQRVAVDSRGNVYVTDEDLEGIVKVGAEAHSFSTLVAGNVTVAPASEPGRTVKLDWPAGIAADVSEGLFFDDHTRHTVYHFGFHDSSLQIIAGTGNEGFKGDGGPGKEAEFRFPEGLSGDGKGNLFIADTNNCRIQRIDLKTDIVTTITGTEDDGSTCERTPGYGGILEQPQDVGVDGNGNVFFVQEYRHRVRRFDAMTGKITTVAGNGEPGFTGDGGPAINARLHYPEGLAVDKIGNLYISDSFNGRIRRVDLKTGLITTVAGKGPIQAEVIL
jgi:sugar lactone lactonase YvrE